MVPRPGPSPLKMRPNPVKMPLLKDILNQLPQENNFDLLPQIQQHNSQHPRTLVVLDDDPTGTQTVYDIPVLTTWDMKALTQEFSQKTPLFYILTNSRSLPVEEAEVLAKEVGKNLLTASQTSGQPFTVVSRSDSTLRGHYPEEVDALADTLGLSHPTTVIIPAFLEGGRYTIHDIHYVQEDDKLIPAAETPFAQDAAFGYKNSDLKYWVAEKTQGKISAAEVLSITLEDIRQKGVDYISQKLLTSPEQATCIINAASRSDLEIVGLALLKAESQGKSLVYRTAASIVPVLAGLPPKPLLSHTKLSGKPGKGGLVIIGSYVPKTSTQLEHLKKLSELQFVEVNVNDLLSPQKDSIIQQITNKVESFSQEEETVVVYTSRTLITGEDKARSLQIGRQISEGLVRIVQQLSTAPAFILSKGGITSNDIATHGLGVKRAIVMGQILPGVPMWELENESRFPGVPYIVFPGNVGGPEALSEIVKKLSS